MKMLKLATLYTSIIMFGSATAAYAEQYQTPMQSGQQHEVTYITGGIGEEEVQGMHAIKENYNLYIMSSHKDGGFTGDTEITISDSQGNIIIASLAGPLFYADLPNGKYTVKAVNRSATQTKNTTIRQGRNSNLHFVWN